MKRVDKRIRPEVGNVTVNNTLFNNCFNGGNPATFIYIFVAGMITTLAIITLIVSHCSPEELYCYIHFLNNIVAGI